MTDATNLWAAVVAAYPSSTLLQLTNSRKSSATSIDTTRGEDAAQTAIDLWPAWAQEDYDSSKPLHVQLAKRAVVAVLIERGGAAPKGVRESWANIFTDAILKRLAAVGARGRVRPRRGRVRNPQHRAWSDPDGVDGMLPSDRLKRDS